MLHGWGCCIATFAPVIDELQKFRRVIAIDFPGFGESSPLTTALDVRAYTEIIAEFIRVLDIAGTDIIAHSFGGRVSILLASLYPELTGKIVFTDAAGIRPKRGLKYYGEIYAYKLCKKAAGSKFGTKVFRLFGIDVKKRIQNAGSADYKALSGPMRETFVKVVNQDPTPYLSAIKSPSLMIYGRDDRETPVKFGEIMEKRIPDSGLVVLENAGHYSYLDQFVRYMSIVKTFLGVTA